jgi:hypothetical protein
MAGERVLISYSAVVKLQGGTGSVCTAPAPNTTSPGKEIVMPVQCTCLRCGVVFYRAPSGVGPYCSTSCRSAPLEKRFWSKVDKDGPVPEQRPDLGPCWLWLPTPTPGGYGLIWVNGAYRGAHVVAWEMEHGPLPDDKIVMHRCDRRNCVRNDPGMSHVIDGTYKSNMEDMYDKGRADPPKGNRQPRSRLTPEVVLVIRAERKRGVSTVDLAQRYGVTRSAVSHATRGSTWRWLKES